MKVSDAVNARRSIRAFQQTPVADDVIADLLRKASRAPSGGNLQPWWISVLNGDLMQRFLDFLSSSDIENTPAYDIYPKDLKAPYRDSRFKSGEDMYALLGIPRENKAARFAHLARNYTFFDAPAGLFCFVDRQMGKPSGQISACFCRHSCFSLRSLGLCRPTR